MDKAASSDGGHVRFFKQIVDVVHHDHVAVQVNDFLELRQSKEVDFIEGVGLVVLHLPWHGRQRRI